MLLTIIKYPLVLKPRITETRLPKLKPETRIKSLHSSQPVLKQMREGLNTIWLR